MYTHRSGKSNAVPATAVTDGASVYTSRFRRTGTTSWLAGQPRPTGCDMQGVYAKLSVDPEPASPARLRKWCKINGHPLMRTNGLGLECIYALASYGAEYQVAWGEGGAAAG